MNGTSAILDLYDPSWVAFVESNPEATPFHQPVWASLIADCYGLRGFVFALFDSRGEIVAGMPIIEVRRGRRWVSAAFTDYCAPLGNDAARKELIIALEDRRRQERIRSVEVRADVGGVSQPTTVGFRHQLALDAEPAELFKRFSRKKVQQPIRKAEREGVRVWLGSTRSDLDVFYSLHLATRRRLGVPIQPRAFFDGLWDRLIRPGLGAVFVAEINNTPIAAAVFLGWRQTLIYKFGASDRAAWTHSPNHAVLWHAIQWATENEFASLDFGRTDLDNPGLRAFKASWGTTESDLIYSVLGTPPVQHAGGVASRALSAVIRHSPEIVCRELGERLYRYTA